METNLYLWHADILILIACVYCLSRVVRSDISVTFGNAVWHKQYNAELLIFNMYVASVMTPVLSAVPSKSKSL